MNLNVAVDFFDHPKTKRLIRLLGRGSEVLPLKLWVYGARYFPKDGRLAEISAQEIEEEVRWWGEVGKCVKVMVETEFLELDGDTYVIHDWAEHQGHIWAMSEQGRRNAQKRWGKLVADDAGSNASSNAASNAGRNAPSFLPTSLPLPPKAPQGGAEASRRSKTRRSADERADAIAREKARIANERQAEIRRAEEAETAAKLAADLNRIRAKVEADGEQSLERWDRAVWVKNREEESCKVAKSA